MCAFSAESPLPPHPPLPTRRRNSPFGQPATRSPGPVGCALVNAVRLRLETLIREVAAELDCTVIALEIMGITFYLVILLVERRVIPWHAYLRGPEE